MELKVASTLFNSSGGGGGAFYFGRNPETNEEASTEQDSEAPEFSNDVTRWSRPSLSGDGSLWQNPSRSRLLLSLVSPPTLELPEETSDNEDEVRQLHLEIGGKIRVLNFAVTRLESAFQRRLHAEVGDIKIG
ncbi:MAG: hypothetical protein VKN33_07760 [Candidatus Sericytochromatia bacterium]|nr:hypothetical protein [Candidatus Sericytochromatia bacterium]